MNKHCRNCDAEFTASGTSVVYCDNCNTLRSRKMVAKGVQREPCRTNFVRYRAMVRHNGKLNHLGTYDTQSEAEQIVADFRAKHAKVSQGQWAKDNMRSSGIGYYKTRAKEILQERKHCNRCNKFLLNVGRYEWCVHHIDHDRTNNVDSNFELLCKRCHQLEHCKHDPTTGRYTQGSTTIPKGSTAQANGAGSGGKPLL